MGSDPTIQIDALAKKLKLGMADHLSVKLSNASVCSEYRLSRVTLRKVSVAWFGGAGL